MSSGDQPAETGPRNVDQPTDEDMMPETTDECQRSLATPARHAWSVANG